MRLSTALRLGRVSNLPTVWTNVAAGTVLAGGLVRPGSLVLACLGASLLYVAGMFLNDAFDAEHDAAVRAERPIPQGEVGRTTVFRWGFGLLGLGVSLFAVVSIRTGTGGPLLAALATAGLVVLYDAWHESNPAAPWIMGLCRAGLYVIGATMVGPALGVRVLVAASLLVTYVAGITLVARSENSATLRERWPLALLYAPLLLLLIVPTPGSGLIGPTPGSAIDESAAGVWPPRLAVAGFVAWLGHAQTLLGRGRNRDVRGGVMALIAGISLVDAMWMARFDTAAAAFGVGAFALTLVLQRRIAGT